MADDGISVRLMTAALDAAAAISFVTCAEAGGIDVFIGTTRAEEHGELGPLKHLEYHAYEEMAVRELEKLAAKAKGEFGAARIAVWHRLGRVAVGEASVVIAVSCGHRAAAFAACRWLIDELKKLAPIWKKERYTSSERWQGDVNSEF